VEIRILCRGICCLVPGVPGMSENIKVRSVLGRFLEHSRVYIFEAGDRDTFYFGSADLMQRNLDQRIEVVVPALDPKVQQELSAIFDIGWDDKAFVWQFTPDGSWKRIGEQGKRKLGVSSQDLIMRRARARTARKKSKTTKRIH
jgi:polyphosphate kinase